MSFCHVRERWDHRNDLVEAHPVFINRLFVFLYPVSYFQQAFYMLGIKSPICFRTYIQ